MVLDINVDVFSARTALAAAAAYASRFIAAVPVRIPQARILVLFISSA